MNSRIDGDVDEPISATNALDEYLDKGYFYFLNDR